jgi:hypothetical protein
VAGAPGFTLRIKSAILSNAKTDEFICEKNNIIPAIAKQIIPVLFLIWRSSLFY